MRSPSFDHKQLRAAIEHAATLEAMASDLRLALARLLDGREAPAEAPRQCDLSAAPAWVRQQVRE